MVDARNPLTARVAVNRVWQLFFGTGLVRTASDFGAHGEWPSHPELLDWLACEFQESGWDVKHLVRQIVTSETYRQSSTSTPAALARDPDNRLLARGPRTRLPAELVRDSALKISGLLVEELGGPSVNPTRAIRGARSAVRLESGGGPAFNRDHGEKLYRRSLYTYWKRTLPPPNMALFDAPKREVCTFERASTNTPLQALVLLNDVQFVEAARAFAERILHRPGDDERRLAWAFAEATARAPTPAERAVLARALAREREHFAADGRQRKAPARANPAHASHPRGARARAQVAALLLNLSETVTKD